MVQVIHTICTDSLISDAFRFRVYIILDNKIMSEIQVLAGIPEKIEQFEDLAVDGNIILKWILNK